MKATPGFHIAMVIKDAKRQEAVLSGSLYKSGRGNTSGRAFNKKLAAADELVRKMEEAYWRA
jgi:hypothetical protein